MVRLCGEWLFVSIPICLGPLLAKVDGKPALRSAVASLPRIKERSGCCGRKDEDASSATSEKYNGVTDADKSPVHFIEDTPDAGLNDGALHSWTEGLDYYSIDPRSEMASENTVGDAQITFVATCGSADELRLEDLKDAVKNPAMVPPHVAQLIILACFICLSACLLQFVISKVNEKIPISIACFIFGMITYAFAVLLEPYGFDDPLSKSINGLRRIDSSVLYYGVLPILLYEATQDINWYSFCNFFLGGISLAIVGVVLQVGVLGLLFHYVLNISPSKHITLSFLLASILSSTDPVAVLAVLSGVKAHPKLSSIFNGESLINDGSSVLLFQFFYLLLVGETKPIWYHILVFCKLLLLSPLLGMIVGVIVTMWISIFRKHHSAQCLAVITVGHLLYFISEYTMNLSGPLAIVCYGVFIKAYGLIAFDREALDKHHHFVEGICLIANSAVFMISGALTVGMLQAQLQGAGVLSLLGKLIAMYILLNLARAFMILVFSPLLSYVGYGLNYKETLLLIWGGLRGAIVLVMGLRLESDRNTPDEISDLLAFYIGGSVMLILLLQGLTFEMLYRLLRPYPMKPFRRVYLLKVMKVIDREFSLEVEWLRTHWLFKNTDAVERAIRLVPKMATIRWNATGNLEFDIPDIDNAFAGTPVPSPIQTHLFQEGIQFDASSQIDRCHTLYSCSVQSDNSSAEDGEESLEKSQGIDNDASKSMSPRPSGRSTPRSQVKSPRRDSSPVEETDNTEEKDRPLLTYSIMNVNYNMDNLRYDPKRYLQLLEHSVTDDMGSSQDYLNQSTMSYIMESNSVRSTAQPNVGLSDSIVTTDNTLTRSDTDATINLDNLYQRPVHKRFAASTVVPRMESDDRIFEDSQYEGGDGQDSDHGNSGVRRVLRKEQEGELYIMIFNAFSDMYNKLYHSALIDGGSLLMLQATLDTASDFALKKLQKRSIAAWAAVLADAPPDCNFVESEVGVEAMDGFEFEWFVLHSMIEKRVKDIDGWFGIQFLNFSQHNAVQSVLELLVSYIDVHQHLLDRGGRNLELLLEGKLLNSFRAQISKAKCYIASLYQRFPQKFDHGLITMGACMMLRIKRDVVNEQSTQGLLLEEDRVRIVEILEDQLFSVATTHNRISMFKRIFRRAFHALTCWYLWRRNSS